MVDLFLNEVLLSEYFLLYLRRIQKHQISSLVFPRSEDDDVFPPDRWSRVIGHDAISLVPSSQRRNRQTPLCHTQYTNNRSARWPSPPAVALPPVTIRIIHDLLVTEEP